LVDHKEKESVQKGNNNNAGSYCAHTKMLAPMTVGNINPLGNRCMCGFTKKETSKKAEAT